MTRFTVNGKTYEINDIDPSTPLLWVLRDHLGLVGTKFGCGIGQCGACTVHVNDTPMKSCLQPLGSVANQKITTIEGLAAANGDLHPLQQAWIEHDVPQCGYCQAGQLMSAAALLKQKKNPTDSDIDAAMNGNICRCGTYLRVRAAIHSAARASKGAISKDVIKVALLDSEPSLLMSGSRNGEV
ncbi:MAG: (2Fe-2S)-binding protein [Pseudomonadota bacterium]